MKGEWLGLGGRVVVVTGGGSGIGAGIARAFTEAGAVVALVDRDGGAAEGVAKELAARGVKASAFHCDVTSEVSVAQACMGIEKVFGRVEVLVNNAGILRPGPLESVSIDTWNEVLAVNLTGYLIAAKAFGGGMLASGRGAIVNIASVAATQNQPRSGAYSAAKAGVLQLSKQLAVEWGPRGVRSNAVQPGLIRTPLSAAFYENKDFEARRSAMIPLRRIGEPTDVANAAVFLASDRASYINGAELLVDGGLDDVLMEQVPRPGY